MSRMITCPKRVYLPYSLQDQRLLCDGVSLEAIVRGCRHAASTSTARAPIREAYRAIDERVRRLSARDPLRAEGQLDAGAPARAARAREPRRRELGRARSQVALRAGFAPARHRVHRRRQDPRRSWSSRSRTGVGAINVESPGELDRIAAIAARRGARRAWPCASTRTSTPRAIPTSRRASRPTSSAWRWPRRRRSTARAAACAGLRFVGVHVHIGSQITTRRAADARRRGAGRSGLGRCSDDGVALEHVDLGGGLGMPTTGVPTITPPTTPGGAAGPSPLRPAGRARAGTRDGGARGRAGGAGGRHQAVSRRPAVRGVGRRHDRADAAGAVRLLPPHRAAWRRAARAESAVGRRRARSARAATCSRATGSCPSSQVDDLVALLDTGAYGAVMASNYNRRLLAPEVLVDDGRGP